MNGYVHSAPVPQIYKVAATIAELVQERGSSIKELVFSKKYSRINTKGLYALIVETLQHESILCDLIRESKILANGRMKPWLARVLITELLWGKKKLPPNDCKPIKAVLDCQSEFLAILRKAVLEGTHQNEPRSKKALVKPRYIRVNTLKLSIEDAMDAFLAEGWYRGYPEIDNDYASFLKKVSKIEDMEFLQDFHIKEVFVFPPRTEFYGHELYTSGMLLLQDKATCLAPFLLAPPPGSVVLDMCAAPGLKTTQLAAIMQNSGTLFAVEKDQRRYGTLVEFAANHGANISAIHADASTLTPLACPDVEYIMIDPSCSGSGMLRPTNHEFEPDRVQKLAAFQVILLERALVNFPTVKRVVYSTCSNYAEENEQVVEKVMRTVNPDPANPNYRLADVLVDSWISRGSGDYEGGEKCLYAREEVDFTTGFFVAVFERVGQAAIEPQAKRKRIRGKKQRELVHKGAVEERDGVLAEDDEKVTNNETNGNGEEMGDEEEVVRKKNKKKRKREKADKVIGEDGEKMRENKGEVEEVVNNEGESHVGEEETELRRKEKKKRRKEKEEGIQELVGEREENEVKEEVVGTERESIVEEEETEPRRKEKKKRRKEKEEGIQELVGEREENEVKEEVVGTERESIAEEEEKERRRKEKKRRKRERENVETVVGNGETESSGDVVKRTKHKKSKNVDKPEEA